MAALVVLLGVVTVELDGPGGAVGVVEGPRLTTLRQHLLAITHQHTDRGPSVSPPPPARWYVVGGTWKGLPSSSTRALRITGFILLHPPS